MVQNRIISGPANTPAGSSDAFAVKNYILTDSSAVPGDLSVDTSFMYEGFTMIICVKGTVKITINFHQYELAANQVLTVLPCQIVKVLEKSEDLFLEVLFFSAGFMSDFPLLSPDSDILFKLGENPLLPLTKVQMQDLLELHSVILKHYEDTGKPFREEFTKALLYALIVEIGSLYMLSDGQVSLKRKSRQEQLTESFFKLLLIHFRQERSVKFYAGELCVTPKYLTTIVKNISRHSILEWINEVVIIEAKRLLKSTNNTVQQISEDLNFPNPSFFGRFFKQYTGVTPLFYRNQM